MKSKKILGLRLVLILGLNFVFMGWLFSAQTVTYFDTFQFLQQAQFSQFNDMLSKARDGGTSLYDVMVKRLNNFTVFVPTDTAINQFGKIGLIRDAGGGVVGNQGMLLEFISTHIINPEDMTASWDTLRRTTTGIKTRAGCKIFVSEENQIVYVWATENLPKEQRSQILYYVVTQNSGPNTSLVCVIDRPLISPNIKAKLDRATKVVQQQYALLDKKNKLGQKMGKKTGVKNAMAPKTGKKLGKQVGEQKILSACLTSTKKLI